MKANITIFAAVIISALFLSGCAQTETDVQLTRRIFNSMCKGNQSVQNLIDWENFKAMDTEVGKTYSGIVSEKERADYRKMFFYNLAYTFKASGGKTSGFTNWRVKSKDPNSTVVAADMPSGKTMLLTLSHKAGKRKLIVIELGL